MLCSNSPTEEESAGAAMDIVLDTLCDTTVSSNLNQNKRKRKPVVYADDSDSGEDVAGKNISSSSLGVFTPDPEKKKRKEKLVKEKFVKVPQTASPAPPVIENSEYRSLMRKLMDSGETFVQNAPCYLITPNSLKCRECTYVQDMSAIFCRFFGFRRLKFFTKGSSTYAVRAGFVNIKDVDQGDLVLWLPNPKNPPKDLNLDVAIFILRQVGDQFCDLIAQEREAVKVNIAEDKKIAWKKVVPGVREMCDVCDTTLFNFHWVCIVCGFVACIDCYKSRVNGTLKIWGECGADRDEMSWILCTDSMPHQMSKLKLTQIIAGNAMKELDVMLHKARAMWDIRMYCECSLSSSFSEDEQVRKWTSICKEILSKIKQEEKLKKESELNFNVETKTDKDEMPTSNDEVNYCKNKENQDQDSLSWLADVALSKQTEPAIQECDDSSSDDDEGKSSFRAMLTQSSNKASANDNCPADQSKPVVPKKHYTKSNLEMFDELLNSVSGDHQVEIENDADFVSGEYANGVNKNTVELRYFIRKHKSSNNGRHGHIPIRVMTLTESKLLYPDVPHSWLCDGRLLRLLDPSHPKNITIFQDQWRRGQPVIVSDVSNRLDPNLWNPESFIRDFGEIKNDLINCMSGRIVPNQPMRIFWEGFERLSKRLKDEKGNTMLLKLKDWPPGEDFAELLPSRYQDLMKVLPLSEYTWRTGKLNLASRLPESFVRPDLGPKMYNAYGSALHPDKGTTNLHLDISDAVNVMVYVGIPKDDDYQRHIKEANRAIDEAGCDILTRERVREHGELPGALWHIYNARDSDKIRDLLNKVAIEKGARLEPNHDPIHDQSWYLDGSLRERLFREYSVEGYAIVQCMGDAVFIPAGAPHQVRNLHNCIKVAEDFVSPENISCCFHLTQEFRDLSDTHSNHEDKLQIKNIMYHAVKDSLSVLNSAFPLFQDNHPPNNVQVESSDQCPVSINKAESITNEEATTSQAMTVTFPSLELNKSVVTNECAATTIPAAEDLAAGLENAAADTSSKPETTQSVSIPTGSI